MDKVMVTLLLIIAGVVCSVVIINAAFPAITGSTGAITDTASKLSDILKSIAKHSYLVKNFPVTMFLE